jgi:S-sulfo-L-cysteine synthase (O-acetyl-L-serine-dependent)
MASSIVKVRNQPTSTTLIESVGNTPLLELTRIKDDLSEGVRIFAKAEWFNPSGSVKDRPAAFILQKALANGELDSGRILLDSTSGNMGISYAMFAASLGQAVHLAIPSNASRERMTILKMLGAELTLTDPLEGSDGARIVAAEMAEKNPGRYFFADQYRNDENWRAHYETTGPEIASQTNLQVTHFIAGLGTSGTLMGAGRYLKEQDKNVQLIAAQPDGPLHGLEGLKHMQSSPLPEIYDPSFPDEIRTCSTESAYGMSRHLAQEEGLLVGVSSGAAAQIAIEVAHEINEGLIVVVFPDSAYKYLDLSFWSEAP